MKKGKTIRLSLFIIAVLGILDTVFILSRSGNVDTGILLPAIAGVGLLLGIAFTKTQLYRKNYKLCNKAGKVILVLFTVWLLSFIVVIIIILTSAISQEGERVDSVIVLGAGIKGEAPSLVLQERLNYTIDYLNKNRNASAIVSGGQGIGENITEAEVMKRYLVSHGISADRIIKEENSTSTYENMVYSKKVYEETMGKELNKVMIITNDFHMYRSKLLAERAGLEPYGISSATPWYIYPNVFLREYLAVFKSLIFDR
jgi:uncharacterized SAM-binding protein YcdF (DUF218 family)